MPNIQSADIETPKEIDTNMATINPINDTTGKTDYQKMQDWNNATKIYEEPQQQTNQAQNTVQPQTQQYQTQQVNNQVNTPVETIKPSVSVKIPSDLNDNTVQGYLSDYKQGVQINDYQAQINALQAIDDYRTSQGYQPIYTNNIYDLTNQRVDKIKGIISEYEADMQEAVNMGDYELSQQIGKQLEAYKKSVNYKDTINDASAYLANVEYKSTWDSAINGIIGQLLTSQFAYDPSNDQALLKAQKYATNTVYESMNSKGILDSTMTAQIVAKTVDELIPVYQKMAKEEFNENISRLQTVANLLMDLDDREYARWQDSVQRGLETYEIRKDEIEYQWNRVNQMGYVDNTASVILGVPVGSMSPSVRESIRKAEQEAQNEYNKLYTDMQLAQAKAEIELQTYEAKKMIDSAYNNEVSVYAQKKAIDAMYKTTGSTNTSISTGEYAGMTDTDKKKTIKTKYDNGEITDIEAIQEIYNNFDTSKQSAMLSDVVGLTKKEADDILYNDAITNDMSNMREAYGAVTNENRVLYENEIVNGLNNGIITEDYANRLLEEVDKDLEYSIDLDYYIKQAQNNNKVAKDNSKKMLKKIVVRKYGDSIIENEEELVQKYGIERYNSMLEQVQAIEDDTRSILKDKGIDW